jgi:hypothetical protein
MVNLQQGPVENKINEIRFNKEFLSYICDLLAIVLFICIVLVLVFFIVIFQILSIIDCFLGKVLALTFLTLTELCELLFCSLLLSTLSQIIIGRNSRELFFTIIALHFSF